MNKSDIASYIDSISENLNLYAKDIWDFAEIAGKEKQSADLFRDVLRKNNFDIHEIDGMEHAFYAEYGNGYPVIAILAEYDALPDLSQMVEAKRNPGKAVENGHGCGHNLLGVACLGGALAIKKYLDESDLGGTIRFYGCPEEETLSGKVKMVHKGAFEGCDIAISWHPMTSNTPTYGGFLANNSIKYRFHGVSSHAAAAPESGRSALDAVELMNIGANYLREHVIDSARIHYTITNAGGAPNIVPSEAESWYFVRAPHRKDVDNITNRLTKISEGASLMTETTTDNELLCGCYEILENEVLFDLTLKNMNEMPIPKYTEEEKKFVAQIQESLDPATVEFERKKFSCDEGSFIHEGVLSKEKAMTVKLTGSSDVGDVSWNMPMAIFLTATWTVGVPPHSWQATALSGSSIGMKSMQYASKVIAGIVYDVLNDNKIVEDAKVEFSQRTKTQKYKCPLDK